MPERQRIRRVGLIGAGYFAGFHRDAWARCPDVQVVAVCDQELAKAEAAAKRFSAAKVYDDPDRVFAEARLDLVDIITPPASHAELCLKAASHGVGVICQKPLAPTFAEAVALVEAMEAKGALLVVHENFRFMPWHQEAARLVQAGAIGRPLSIAFHLRPGDGQGPDAYLARQPYFRTMERFLVHETAIHLIDVFRAIMGEPTGVFARLKRFNPAIFGEDAGLIVFDFANGAQGLFDGNRLIDHEAENTRLTFGTMVIEGEDGGLRLDGAGRLFLRKPGGRESEHHYEWSNHGFGGDSVYRLTRSVLDALQAGRQPANTGRDYLANLLIEEAVYQSAQEERWIALGSG